MEQSNRPEYGKLILVPSLITLGITLLRLAAEFMDFPPWLASKSAGGPGALIGISWLPPILGVYFAFKLAEAPGKPWWNLFKALVLYGFAARIPVIIIMGLAIYGNWGTPLRCIYIGKLSWSHTHAEIHSRGRGNPAHLVVEHLDTGFRHADGPDHTVYPVAASEEYSIIAR